MQKRIPRGQDTLVFVAKKNLPNFLVVAKLEPETMKAMLKIMVFLAVDVSALIGMTFGV